MALLKAVSKSLLVDSVKILLEACHVPGEVLELEVTRNGEVLKNVVELGHFVLDVLKSLPEDKRQVRVALRDVYGG